MAICQKYSYQNYQNLIIGFQVTVKKVGDVSLRHNVRCRSISPNRSLSWVYCRGPTEIELGLGLGLGLG